MVVAAIFDATPSDADEEDDGKMLSTVADVATAVLWGVVVVEGLVP